MIKTLSFRSRVATLLLGAAVTGCDYKVTNPGPVQDASLNAILAHEALATGAERIFSEALTYITHHGAVVAFETKASGLTGGAPGSVGHPEKLRQGILNDQETGVHWQWSQQARWLGEDAVRRMQATVPNGDISKYAPALKAYIWAAYANRLLGENMCTGVIDGGAALDSKVYFTRADSEFTAAITIATALNDATRKNAAIAGRATVRADLGRWTDAVADANLIPTTFVFQALFSTLIPDEYNAVAFANLNQPHRSDTVLGTFYEAYYTQMKDPRVAWSYNPAIPFGGPAPEGQIKWEPPLKYTKTDSPENLATGREMRLIEAEAKLINGDAQGALTAINALRTATGVAVWPATTDATTVWTDLKRERGIELWLEGRRLNDLRRWLADKRPGTQEDMTGRSLCFPVPLTEKQSNPNFF
jgi:hypothetical protein